MEGTSQDSNSINHNHHHHNRPKVTQIPSSSSPVIKLPLAPILLSSTDRRGASPTVSNRRGSSIFSPTAQTLDHQPFINNINPTHQSQLNPTPQYLDHPTSDSDPNHAASGGVTTSSIRTSVQTPQNQNFQPNPAADGDQELATKLPTASVLTSSANKLSTTGAVIRYKECLKNHAANMGGHVLDGCGEFMPGGEEGTLESLRCAACDCHRNFHRKEIEGESQLLQRRSQYNNYSGNVNSDVQQRTRTTTTLRYNKLPTMVNFGGGTSGNNVATESSSEELNVFDRGHFHSSQSSGSKKRFRTKFNQEQKDKMHDFATRIGWRIQRQDDQEVTRFCNEIGVKRQVFKVWMHNNKQAVKRRSSSSSSDQQV